MLALAFLPFIAQGGIAPRDEHITLGWGNRLTVTCGSEVLAVSTQSRTSLSMECARDSDMPFVPLPTEEARR